MTAIDAVSEPGSPAAGRIGTIVGGKSALAKVFENFQVLSESTGGIDGLRRLVLELGVTGRLLPRVNWEGDASDLLASIATERAVLLQRREWLPRQYEDIPTPGDRLPTSWRWARLGEIVRDHGQREPIDRFTYLDVSSIDNKTGRLRDDLQVLAAADAPSRARKLVATGAVIYSTVRPYLLNVTVLDHLPHPEPIVSTAFAVLQPLGGIESRYLYYFLRSPVFIHYVSAQMAGIAYPAINDSKLYSGWVSLPPLGEQKRIVTKVDQLMALCDDLEARQTKTRNVAVRLTSSTLEAWETADTTQTIAAAWQRVARDFPILFASPESVDALRQALLGLAIRGRLVAQQPDESALEIRSAQQTPFPLPSTWRWAHLEEIASNIVDCLHATPKYVLTGFPAIRTSDVVPGRMLVDQARQVDEREYQDRIRRLPPRAGDIFYSREGGRLGIAACVPTGATLCLSQRMMHIRVRSEIDPTYVMWAMNSRFVFAQAVGDTGGSASPHPR